MDSSIGIGVSLDNADRAILAQIASGYTAKEIASNIGITKNQAKRLRQELLTKTGFSSFSELLQAAQEEGLIERALSWSNDLRLPPANPFLASGYSSTMHANAASSDATINRGPGTSGNYQFVATGNNGYAVPTILMDSKGALIAIGVAHDVNGQNPTVLLLDPRTLDIIDKVKLPAPSSSEGHVAGGIYSFIDHQNNLVLVNIHGEMQWYSNSYDLATNKGSLSLVDSIDIGQPGVVGTVPDYEGNIWYATQASDSAAGVGYYNKKTGNSAFYELPDGETVANSISSSPTGVAVASTKALYLFQATADGPLLKWRQPYVNSGDRKPGQLSAGTGSSPTFFGPKTGFEYVTIADNGSPTESINVYKTRTGKLLSSIPFLQGGVNSGTENSSIGIGSSVFTPSTYGYWYPPSSESPKNSVPVEATFVGGAQLASLSNKALKQIWANLAQSTALPRLSVPDGLIYTTTGQYGQNSNQENTVQYYFSAIDAITGTIVTSYELDGQFDQYFGQPQTNIPFSYNQNTLQMVGTISPNKTIYQGLANGLFRISGPDAGYGIGVTSNGFSFTGEYSYDGNGYTYSQNAMEAADTSLWQGPKLEIQGKGANSNNFTWANGQTILVDGDGDGANTLTLFGSAVNETQQGVDITINYTDGTQSTWTQSFSDWTDPLHYPGEAIYSTQAYRNLSNGSTDNTSTNIYAYQYSLASGKQVHSITLPFEHDIRILDIAVSSMYQVDATPNTFLVAVTLPNGDVQQIAVNISNADLAAGTNLRVITDLGINPAGLTTLAELGVTANDTGLDFQLALNPGSSASLNAMLELVAADLLPQLSDPSGRLPARKLLYYAVNAAGALSPLTYDPITSTGARFYDLDNNGTADFFTLSLIDGGYGDKDEQVNGIIDDPSFAGFADLPNLQFTNSGTGAVTVSDPSNTAPAAVNLRASLLSRPTSSNQIGYVVLNASEVANVDSLLRDLAWLRGRAQTLFSTLESTDVTLPAGIAFDRDLQLINGHSLRFFEVVDASLDQLSSLSDSRFRLLNPGSIANDQVAFSTSSGVRFSLSLLPGDPGLNALINNAQGLAPVLDLTTFTTAQNLSGTVMLGREADYTPSVGFYRTLDITGLVIAADGITRLRPGDSGYSAAALRPANLVSQLNGLTVADNQTTTLSFSGVSGGSFLAPFAQVNGETFFAYGAANRDGIDHFRSLGNGIFGLEDMLGGGDLDNDDLVFGFNFTTVV